MEGASTSHLRGQEGQDIGSGAEVEGASVSHLRELEGWDIGGEPRKASSEFPIYLLFLRRTFERL